MYKKLGNYNNYNNYKNISIKAPIITATRDGAPSEIRSKYPNGEPDTCDSIIVGKNGDQILTLEPDTYVSYYNTHNNINNTITMKCSRDPKTNIGSVMCYAGENPTKCCPGFSGPGDIPVIIGAISDSYTNVLKALDQANKSSKSVDFPQCINLKPNTPPAPPPPCCGVKDKNGTCSPRGKFIDNKCVCDQGFDPEHNCDSVINMSKQKVLLDDLKTAVSKTGKYNYHDLVVCPYGLDTLDVTKTEYHNKNYYTSGCYHGKISETGTNFTSDLKNCYVLSNRSGGTLGPDCLFGAKSKAGKEWDINVQQNYGALGPGDISIDASNYIYSKGSFTKMPGVVIIGPK